VTGAPMIGFGSGSEGQTCSRASCSNPAGWNINWRNPRIHGPERVKIWLACDEHRDYLHDYLEARDFPVVVTALDEPLDRLPDVAPDVSSSVIATETALP
jgi:hypothetical protein